jgi:hypothetical protein
MSEMKLLADLRPCCARPLLLPSPACCSSSASTHMPALRVSKSKRLRLRLRLILGKGVRGKPLLKNLLGPEQRVNQPNIQKPKGAERPSQVVPPKGMTMIRRPTMLDKKVRASK